MVFIGVQFVQITLTFVDLYHCKWWCYAHGRGCSPALLCILFRTLVPDTAAAEALINLRATLIVALLLQNEHRVPEAIKAVAFANGFLIGFLDQRFAGECAHEQQQR